MCISLWTHIGKILWPVLPCANTLSFLIFCNVRLEQSMPTNTNCQRTRGKNLKAHQLEPYTALKISRPKLVPEKAKNHTYPSHMSQQCIWSLSLTSSQSILAFFHIAINDCFDHGFNTDCLFVQRNQQLCIETYQRGKAVSIHPTGNVSGSSPPKKPEDVRSFLPRLHHKMNSWSFFSPFWTYDMRNSTISRNSSIYKQDLPPPYQSWICSLFARQQQFRSQHLRPLRSQTLHFWQSIACEKRCEGKRPQQEDLHIKPVKSCGREQKSTKMASVAVLYDSQLLPSCAYPILLTAPHASKSPRVADWNLECPVDGRSSPQLTLDVESVPNNTS